MYFMITWTSGPVPQANGPKVILTSRDPLNRHISVSCLRAIIGGETLVQIAGHFLTALLTQAFPLITFWPINILSGCQKSHQALGRHWWTIRA